MEIAVNLQAHSYTVQIRPALIAQAATELRSLQPSSLFVIADQHVADLYAKQLIEPLAEAPFEIHLLTFPPGESSKSIAQAQKLWDELLKHKIDRQSLILALGGGVTGDLAGFVAATILRGVRFVQVPTTLLAQVDSSVGGKVGVNLAQAKNIVGCFWQPHLVLIDPNVLKTLDTRQFVAGMAEVIKYGMIMDAALFAQVEQQVDAIKRLDQDTIVDLVGRCCELKAEIVQVDEREMTGRRAILNYGHTFGHAIEQVYGYGAYLHGEAIAIGMTMAARLAVHIGLCDRELLDRQTRLFAQFGLPTTLPHDDLDSRTEALMNCMQLDKKSLRGKFNLILPTRIGQVVFANDLERDIVLTAFDVV